MSLDLRSAVRRIIGAKPHQPMVVLPAPTPVVGGDGENPWNSDDPKPYSGMWFGSLLVQEHINRKISGNPNVEWFEHFWKTYCSHLHSNPNARCLILGASEGWMERHLRITGFKGHILATDIADKALGRAKATSELFGYRDIEYRLADLNVDSFEGPFDCIIAEGVLHHIEKTERMLRHLHDILAPDGIVFGVEWSGPFRFQLPPNQVRWVNAMFAAVPGDLRPTYKGEPGIPPDLEFLKTFAYVPSTEEFIRQMDPSEAIAGPNLTPLLKQVFDIVEWKGFGGTLLAYMGGQFPFERADEDPYVARFVEMLLAMEDKIIESGVLEDEFFAFAARRRSS